MNYDILGQRDPRWASHLLGNSKSITIGGYGCLSTCFALLNGVDVQAFNDWAVAHGHYDVEPHGGYAASFDVQDLNGTVHLGKWSRNYLNDPVPVYVLAPLQASLSPQQPIVIMVNHIPGIGQVTSHYILAIDVSRNGKWICLDPWFGDICTLDRYDSNYARGICEYFQYEVNRG